MDSYPFNQREESSAPTLKLVGLENCVVEVKPCERCQGSGRIPCPQTVSVRTIGLNGVATLQPSTGHPIPCPQCNGKKQLVEIKQS